MYNRKQFQHVLKSPFILSMELRRFLLVEYAIGSTIREQCIKMATGSRKISKEVGLVYISPVFFIKSYDYVAKIWMQWKVLKGHI